MLRPAHAGALDAQAAGHRGTDYSAPESSEAGARVTLPSEGANSPSTPVRRSILITHPRVCAPASG